MLRDILAKHCAVPVRSADREGADACSPFTDLDLNFLHGQLLFRPIVIQLATDLLFLHSFLPLQQNGHRPKIFRKGRHNQRYAVLPHDYDIRNTCCFPPNILGQCIND